MKITDIFLEYQKKFFRNDKKRKIWIAGRQIGKSFTLGAVLCYKALSRKNGLALCISTGARAASEIIRKCAQFAEAVKTMTNGEIDYTVSYDSVHFSNGSRVLSLPSSTDGANLRGFTSQCVCIDEAAHVWHLEDIMQAINPTLSRDPDAELILATTPAGRNGAFYDLYTRAIDSDKWYVQTTTIHDAIGDGLKTDLAALKSLCPDPDIFAQEYECRFADSYGSLIDEAALDFYDELPPGRAESYIGIDVGVKNDRSAAVVGRSIDGVVYLDDIVVMDKTSFQEQLGIIRDLNLRYNFRAGYVDATGIGYGLAERINGEVNRLISGINFTATNKTPMFEQLRTDIFQHRFKINSKYKNMIIDDFRNVARLVNDAGQVKYQAGRDMNGHSDITSAVVLLLESARKNPIRLEGPLSYMPASLF